MLTRSNLRSQEYLLEKTPTKPRLPRLVYIKPKRSRSNRDTDYGERYDVGRGRGGPDFNYLAALEAGDLDQYDL